MCESNQTLEDINKWEGNLNAIFVNEIQPACF